MYCAQPWIWLAFGPPWTLANANPIRLKWISCWVETLTLSVNTFFFGKRIIFIGPFNISDRVWTQWNTMKPRDEIRLKPQGQYSTNDDEQFKTIISRNGPVEVEIKKLTLRATKVSSTYHVWCLPTLCLMHSYTMAGVCAAAHYASWDPP